VRYVRYPGVIEKENKNKTEPFFRIFLDEADDFHLTSIGGDTSSGSSYWLILLNFEYVLDGCQQKVKEGDDVLFAYTGLHGTTGFLKLTGPPFALLFKPVTLVVTNGVGGLPVSGAQIDGHLTDDLGRVTLTFTKVGTQTLKAEKPRWIRSNALTIQVIVGPSTKL